VVAERGAAVDVEALTSVLRMSLAGYKVPRRMEVWTEPLPRTASGKLLRRVVRERLESG
jgi:acyl-CoA synthetase (AMP-forming)/AMP-acid ligase II